MLCATANKVSCHFPYTSNCLLSLSVLLVHQLGGLSVSRLQRLSVPVWKGGVQGQQWVRSPDSSDPVGSAHQRHAVAPEGCFSPRQLSLWLFPVMNPDLSSLAPFQHPLSSICTTQHFDIYFSCCSSDILWSKLINPYCLHLTWLCDLPLFRSLHAKILKGHEFLLKLSIKAPKKQFHVHWLTPTYRLCCRSLKMPSLPVFRRRRANTWKTCCFISSCNMYVVYVRNVIF